jgi:large subunit ribosomal protein L13
MKTFMERKEDVQRKWYIVDVKDKVLGRMATKIAMILKGKTKASYTPHIDTGDFVIVINAAQVKLTGKKAEKKVYRWHTFFPGGLKEQSFQEMIAKHPERVIELAVKGMLPKGKLGKSMGMKLKVYKGADHPHKAQNPVVLN